MAERPGDLHAQLLACLRHPTLDPQPLARPTAELLLRAHPAVDADATAHDPLWLLFLGRCRNTHPAMERRIAELRRLVLSRPDPALDDLAAALALQGFANGYVLPVSARERAALHRLASMGSTDAEPEQPTTSSILRRAMYAPLIDLDAPALPTTPLTAALVKRTLTDLATERALAEAMPSLGETDREASQQVRAQYESHPYPRWDAPPPPHRADIRAHLTNVPGIDRAALPSAPLATLVAGCGTGYEAIDLARTDPTLAITALDLSRASLAYAQRNAAELGLAIAFVQGDLLDLDPAARRYDVITCTGVLHHLADPLAGLRTLAAVLAPGGVLRIALYSRRARALVREAHALIRANGWSGDDGIRALRAHILALPAGAPLACLTESDDFWSLNGCRDLVFHVLEHHYDLPEIGRMIDAAGLRLAGIDAPEQARTLLGPASPLDLDRWDAIEAEHPALFAGMYHLWCQKPATA